MLDVLTLMAPEILWNTPKAVYPLYSFESLSLTSLFSLCFSHVLFVIEIDCHLMQAKISAKASGYESFLYA